MTAGDIAVAYDRHVLGLERKGLVQTEKQKRFTRWHEAGHALLKLAIPGATPLSRLSDIPRGNAGGVTIGFVEGDNTTYTRDQIVAEMAVLYGGGEAEKIVANDNEHVTSGANSDITKATQLAYSIVAELGMDPVVGSVRLNSLPNGTDIFTGGLSNEINELVVRRVLDWTKAAQEFARSTLEENRDVLEAIADALETRRTLSASEVMEIVDKAGGLKKPERVPRLNAQDLKAA